MGLPRGKNQGEEGAPAQKQAGCHGFREAHAVPNSPQNIQSTL
jgi:hypothetical protein